MPRLVLWSSRRPLYRANLVVLLVLTPFNLLGMLLPYWMETTAVMSYWDKGKITLKNVLIKYGIWRQCSDVGGCRWIYDDVPKADVGEWMYPISLFMVLSSLCHLAAAFCGASQNFLPRDFSRRLRSKALKRLLHRDCPYAEDIGFLAGFFGTLSCIIFMLCTKDKISGGANYQWAFGFCIISSTLTVMASLTLTKSHLMSAPRPPNRRRSQAPSSTSEAGRQAGASPPPLQATAARTEDIHLEERRQGARAEGRRSSSRRTEAHSRFSSSSSRRRRSRTRSRSRERPSHPRPQSSLYASRALSRLVRSPELENIPAAVTPSSAQGPLRPGTHSPSRAGPVMCLHMSDLQTRAASQPEVGSPASAEGPGPSRAAVTSFGPVDPRGGNGRAPKSSKTRENSSRSSELHRTQSETVVVLSPSQANGDVKGDDFPVSRAKGSADEDGGAEASNAVSSQKL